LKLDDKFDRSICQENRNPTPGAKAAAGSI
jgi:hypothetical protein